MYWFRIDAFSVALLGGLQEPFHPGPLNGRFASLPNPQKPTVIAFRTKDRSSGARQPSHEGCFTQSGPFKAFNNVHLHLGVHYAGVLERAGYGSPNPFGGGFGSEARHEDP